ncbi:hypothetical protein EBR56_11220, partial [bacterium]|nr:hypothetical protein [bacterium]
MNGAFFMTMRRSLVCGWLVVAALVTAVRAAEQLPTEAELIAVLRSDAAEADKALACKKLAVKGSAAAVG